jgi:threonine/homoserine/homoserine lactone efflux protein
MAGCLCGLLTLLTASAVGLTALLMALPGAFDVLRYAGTAYLLPWHQGMARAGRYRRSP